MLNGLDMATQACMYLQGIIAPERNQEFSCFADCSHEAGRGVPDSPDPDMHGCRIRLY